MEKFKIQNLKSQIEAHSPLTLRAKVISRVLMTLIAVGVFVTDQKTKALVESHIRERAVVPVIAGFFNLTNTKNSGAVFGLFSESPVWWKTPLLIAISVVLLVAVVVLVVRTQHLRWESSIGLSLILGGALSNLYDRIRAGLVEDFLDFYFRGYHWATFNLADSAIVVGTALIVAQVLFER
jgi:signal peptidase II